MPCCQRLLSPGRVAFESVWSQFVYKYVQISRVQKLDQALAILGCPPITLRAGIHSLANRNKNVEV